MRLGTMVLRGTLVALVVVACGRGQSGEADGGSAAGEVSDGAAPVTVTGPVPQSAESHAFGGAAFAWRPEDLGARGYVEEEFLVTGEANVYEWPEPGPATIRTPDVPYTTRVLIRRPTAREDFSGRIVVEMLNPSNLFDLNIGWAIHHAELVRRGDAWVGITAKPVAVTTLRTFDPERYAALDWGNPLPLDDPLNCEVSGSDSREAENGLVWDVHTQVADWLRSHDPSNPFRYGSDASSAHPVERLYGWGYSQTGSFLFTYVQAIHPRVVEETGQAPFDGYLIAVTSGPRGVNQCEPRIPDGDPRRVIRDAGVPVVHVMTQSDYQGYGPPRREDNDSSTDGFRHYQLAGAGHATPEELLYGPSPEDIVQGGRVPPAMACNEGPRSRFPNSVGFNAILRNLTEWVEDGRPPPSSRRIEMEDGEPVLDEHGNVRGGVRSPLLDVPTSTWMGNSTGESFCRIAGHEVPFSSGKLAELYPGREAYEQAFRARVDELVAERFITPEDGEMLKRDLAEDRVP